MSLYNMVHGYHPLAGYLLNQLNLTPQDCGRFRDAAPYKDPDSNDYWIRILTRNGGPNRESFSKAIDKLKAHPLYIKDADDEYDNTYAYFYFKIPENVVMEFEMEGISMEAVADNDTLKEKTDAFVEAMDKGKP